MTTKNLPAGKTSKIIYWVATSLLSFGMLASGISQILHVKDMDELITHVGYPLYFMSIIGVWKILGVIAILIPNFKLLKEWTYAGFFFLLTGALISHLAIGDNGKAILGPLFQTVFVILSWYFRPADRKIIFDNH
jgi:DoxX-like family